MKKRNKIILAVILAAAISAAAYYYFVMKPKAAKSDGAPTVGASDTAEEYKPSPEDEDINSAVFPVLKLDIFNGEGYALMIKKPFELANSWQEEINKWFIAKAPGFNASDIVKETSKIILENKTWVNALEEKRQWFKIPFNAMLLWESLITAGTLDKTICLTKEELQVIGVQTIYTYNENQIDKDFHKCMAGGTIDTSGGLDEAPTADTPKTTKTIFTQ